MSLKPTTVPTKQLAQNLSSTGMALYLNNVNGWDGVALTAGDFGTQLFAALRNSNNTQLELIELDPSTIASSGITILRRALGYDGGTTEDTETAYDWLAGDTFVELGADTPQIMAYAVEQAGNETVEGVKTFTSSPIVPTPTTDMQAATKKYADDTIAGLVGTADENTYGTTKLSVAPASANTPIAVGTNDGRVPSQGENDALTGTAGTPSATNKYVTADDVATAATADKVVRRIAGGQVTVPETPSADTDAASKGYVDDEITGAAGSVFSSGTQVFNNYAPSADFTDLDLSSVVGARSALVFLYVYNQVASTVTYSIRTNGGSWTTTIALNNSASIVTVLTDSSGVIEWKASNDTITTAVNVIAYLKI